MNYHSQYGQDKYLYETFFKDKRNGVFVDVGAYDGVGLSNTYVFEKELGWTGLCIEPNSTAYAELVKNRTCPCECCCVYDTDGTVKYVDVSGYPTMLSGIPETYDPRMVYRIDQEIRNNGGGKRELDMPCYKLNTLLTRHGITKVDLLSIDTEGSELKILQAVDFSAVDIRVLTVENNFGGTELKDYLSTKGYVKVCDIEIDQVFAKFSV